MQVSFVVMTYNRGGVRVWNLLRSLLTYQTVPAAEVVVVDTSDSAQIAQGVAAACGEMREARYVRRRRDGLFKSWALNVGIQRVDPYSKVVAVTDIDFMFGPHTVEMLLRLVNHQTVCHTIPKRLGADALEVDPFTAERWAALCKAAQPWGESNGPGALQAAERGWWFHVRGYDERFERGLGGMDRDMLLRAARDGMRAVQLPFAVTNALHQWHPESPYKDALNHLVDEHGPVQANPDGWGELP